VIQVWGYGKILLSIFLLSFFCLFHFLALKNNNNNKKLKKKLCYVFVKYEFVTVVCISFACLKC
jgi:hypothetical protein